MDENSTIVSEFMENALQAADEAAELLAEVSEEEDSIDTERIMTDLCAVYPDAVEAAEGIMGYVSGRIKLTPEDAYKVINFERLMKTAANAAAKEAEAALLGHIRMCGARPAENGTDRKNGGKRQAPVSRLSRADRAKIAARAGRGERIEF
jgi:hypothetical protein